MQEYRFFSKSDEIRVENFKRDLTKRQKAIVWLIHLYSYSMGKDFARITNLKDFHLCGVHQTKAKDELEKLVELGIVEWDREQNIFRINEIVEWKAPINDLWDQRRFDELYVLNQKDLQ